MNHPSEWARFFDENTGSYRYKHKGSGVIRNTLMTIGKVFKGTVRNVTRKTAEKATKTIAEKAGQKVGELPQERKQKPVSQDAKKKLANILAKPSAKKKIRWRPYEIESNFGKRNLIKEIFSLNINSCQHVQNSTIPRQDYIRSSQLGHPAHLPWE